MHLLDWGVVGLFCLISVSFAFFSAKKSSQGIESYFAGNRSLSWWLAGTSMAATAFSSDTPLLVTGIIRSRGIWGNWEIWSLGISTMLAVFFFSRLWKRTGVLTEVEFVELRYSGKPASLLRGFKALYWGFFYNAFIIGAWPMTGLVKVMQETTHWGKLECIVFALGLAVTYTSLSGFLGVVLADLFQFGWAMTGSVILACFALHQAGGPTALVQQLAGTDKLSLLPPQEMYGWMAGLFLIQWWAWKNADGGGIAVQRMVSCKNEKESLLSMLWFNIAHYVLRSWPWLVTGLASLVLIPDSQLWVTEAGKNFVDHERAYPRLIMTLLPAGLKGVLVASFFAAFMSTVDGQLNWGSSYLVNDFYKRFLKKGGSSSHYVRVSKIITFILAIAGAIVSYSIQSIGSIFTFVLNFTAGVGPVYLARWFWWRVNAWSEIAAMLASLPLIFLRDWFFEKTGLPADRFWQLLYMVVGTAAIWLPVTLLTRPVPETALKDFFEKVSPPGFWKGRKASFEQSWSVPFRQWIAGTLALFAGLIGPIQIFLGQRGMGLLVTGFAILGWTYVVKELVTASKNQNR